MGTKYTRFIYGAGRYGRMLSRQINEMGGSVDYFVQTDKPDCETIDGVPVISLETMASMKTDKLIYIALNNAKLIGQIEKNIYARCDSNSIIHVYNCRNFISDNLLTKMDPNKPDSKTCIICGNNVDEFQAGGIDNEIFLKYNIVGGGYRKTYKCPYCGAIDRERWLYYVLKNYTDIFQSSGRVLHFAPEVGIETYIRRNENVDYYSGDIIQGRAMHEVDILNIPYKDNIFDYVISNHILEHIADEERAVSEIKRVLKKDGKWIFSFPVCTDIKTYEDKQIVSPEQCLKAYGQRDHVRLYGYDYVERFERYGLKLKVYSPQNELDDELIDKYGFIKKDIAIVAILG